MLSKAFLKSKRISMSLLDGVLDVSRILWITKVRFFMVDDPARNAD
jgi:hypothetical protein